MGNGFDRRYVIKKAAELFLVKIILCKINTDYLCLFESLTTPNMTAEKGLLTEFSMFQDSYKLIRIRGL